MRRTAPLFLFLFLFLALACSRKSDPLASERKTCEELAAQQALRAGLTVDACAREIKAHEPTATPQAQK